MPYKDLQEFLKHLDRAGELKHINAELDPYLEIAEVTDRVSKKFGPALLFDKVKGSKFPVLTNMYGSYARMNMALDSENLDALGERIHEYLEIERPDGIIKKLQMIPKLSRLTNIFPDHVKRGSCQDVVLTGDQVDLGIMPVLTTWPGDAGPFITLPVVFTKNPETGVRNAGMYRMQVYDRNTTGMHWHRHKGGAYHYHLAEKLGKRLEVAVAIGPDPAVTYAATAPIPDEIDEMLFAGFLRNQPVELVKCKTVDLEVPATAEFVLEGYVEAHEKRSEGPFGDHTGFYTLEEEYPVFHITCITHRKNPIYQSTIVGKPPKEDCHMGYAVERLTLPILKKQFAEIEDMHMPWAGVFHNLMLISIHKQYPGHARKIMHAMWGMGQVALEKFIVVFDSDVNLHDYNEVVWKACNNLDPQRDMEIAMGPIDVLDHSSRAQGYGSKVGFDCTKKWPEEGFTRRWPDEMTMSPEVKKKVDEVWGKLGIKG